MPTLENIDGRSLVVNLTEALTPAIQEGKARRERREQTDLARTAQGLAPVPDKNAGNFLRKVAPGIADRIAEISGTRDPDEIDGVRNEAQFRVDTAKRVLGAKTQSEKQKIILEQAEKIRQEGGDTRELLKMSGMSAAEIDLQAQKAQMTGDAALKTLPPPTNEERLAARAALAVRNPQALNAILAQEQADRRFGMQQQAFDLEQQQLAQEQERFRSGQELIGGVFGGAQPPQGEVANTVREGLVARGLPPHVAEGFLLNFQDESGLNPGINEAAPVVPGSRGGFGLAQWTGPRRVALEQFAQQTGRPVDDVDTQLDFLVQELGGSESAAAQSILGAQTPQEAAVAIARDFLRPAPEHLARRTAQYQGADIPAPQQISQQQVASLLSAPGVPQSVKDFAVAEYERQQEAAATPPQEFQITELADGRKYYVDPTGQQPARPVDPTQQAEPVDVAEITNFENEQKLRKEFGGISTVEDFYKVNDSFKRVRASAENPSAAGDLALIFNYMKMLDPGSVVRETEFATAQNAAGVPERVRAQFNRVIDGQRLTEETRDDFVNRADQLISAQATGFNEIVGQYRALAEQYGLEPDRIAQKAEIEGKPPAQAAEELAAEEQGQPDQDGWITLGNGIRIRPKGGQ